MEVAEINSCVPQEMLRIIFSFLPPKDLKAAVLVCKLWSRVGQAPGLWSWVTFHAGYNEDVLEQIRLPRLQKVSILNITAHIVSEELMEQVAIHPGLKKVETEPRWTNLSSVRPELLARAFSKMEDLNLGGTMLTVDQLNCLFASLASDNKSTQRTRLDLLENNLYADGIDPLLLAAAIIRFQRVRLDFVPMCLCASPTVTGAMPQTNRNRDSVAIAIFDALGSSFSFVQYLELNLIDLSAVDGEVLAKEVSKMRWVCLQNCSITPPQATALFTAIGEDGSMLRVLDLHANDLSSVESSLLIPPLQVLKGLYLNGTGLTTNQVETILTGLGNDSNLTHLRLDGIDVSQVDPTKLVKVNHLRVVTFWQTRISIQQIIEILEASMTATNLDKIRWGHNDQEGTRLFATRGTLEQWQKMIELMSRLTQEFYDGEFFGEMPYHPCLCTPI